MKVIVFIWCYIIYLLLSSPSLVAHGLGGGATPYNGLYGEAPPKRGTFFRLQVYKRVRISQFEVCKRVGKPDIEIFKGAFNIYYNISKRCP